MKQNHLNNHFIYKYKIQVISKNMRTIDHLEIFAFYLISSGVILLFFNYLNELLTTNDLSLVVTNVHRQSNSSNISLLKMEENHG